MRAFIFTASLLIAGPSLAQPQLLVELRNAEMICGNCQPIDMRIDFQATLTPWSQPITTGDVGRTFTMPADLLNDIGPYLTSSSGIGFSMVLRSIGPGGTDRFGNVSSTSFTLGSLTNNPQVIRYVPALGLNLSGYTISSITQTLNSLEVTQQSSSRFRLNAFSTFYIYGAVVPEPSALVLLVLGHCLWHWILLFRR
jgi:hypothetical protein